MTFTRSKTALVAYRAISEVAGKAAMFGVTVVAARQLPQESFGIFSLASVFGGIVALATDFGIPFHVARAVAQRPDHAPAILGRWLKVRAVTAVVATLLVIVGVLFSSYRSQAVPIFLFTLAFILSALIDFLFYFFRGVGRSDIESTLTIWQRSTTLGMGLLALWWTTNLTVVASALLLPVVVTLGITVWTARQLAQRSAETSIVPAEVRALAGGPPSAPLRAEFWRDVFPIGAGMLASALYFRIDVFLVDHWSGTDAVALYNASFRLLEAVRLIPGAVMAVVLPTLFRADNSRPLWRVSLGLTAFGAVASAIMWLAADWLVPVVYGTGYAGAASSFRILMLAFPLMALNSVLTSQLIGWHGQRAYATVCGLALVLNLALNVRLIPALSIDGAAWSTVWTEVLVTVGCWWGLRGRLQDGKIAGLAGSSARL